MSDQSPEKYWEYFKKGNVKTELKQAIKTKAWRTKGSSDTLYELGVYDQVTVLKKERMTDLEGKFEVWSDKYGKDVVFLLSKAHLAKPKKGTDAIKPQNFKLDDKNLSISDIDSLVRKHIVDIEGLPGVIQEYLLFLIKKTAKPNSGISFKKEYFKKIVMKDIKAIAKNFGEVLCGLAAIAQAENRTMFPNLNIKKTDKVFFPRSLTEALYDFKICGDRPGSNKPETKYLISVKAKLKGANPNTVKPEDIINLINKSTKLKSAWSTKHEYKIIEILAKESIRYGPCKAILYCLSHGLELSSTIAPDIKASELKTAGRYTKKEIEKKLSEEKIQKKSSNDTFFKDSEKYIEYLSRHVKKEKLNFTKFFMDAISNNVYFMIVTELGVNGAKFETIGDDWGRKTGINHKKIDRIVLRGKHDLNGRMGFDI